MADYLDEIVAALNTKEQEYKQQSPLYMGGANLFKYMSSPEGASTLYDPQASKTRNVMTSLLAPALAGLSSGFGAMRAENKADALKRTLIPAMQGKVPVETLAENSDTLPFALMIAAEQKRKQDAVDLLKQELQVRSEFTAPQAPPLVNLGGKAYARTAPTADNPYGLVDTGYPYGSPKTGGSSNAPTIENTLRSKALAGEPFDEEDRKKLDTLPDKEYDNVMKAIGYGDVRKRFGTKQGEKEIKGAPLYEGMTTSAGDTTKAREIVRSADIQDTALRNLEESYRRAGGYAFTGEERVIQDALSSVDWSAVRKAIETGMRLEQREQALVDSISLPSFEKDGLFGVFKNRLIKGDPAEVANTLRRIVRKANNHSLRTYNRYLEDVGPIETFYDEYGEPLPRVGGESSSSLNVPRRLPGESPQQYLDRINK